MKTLLEYVASWLMVGAFYVLVYACHTAEIVKKIYYDTFRISYRTGQGKFHPYYVRTDNKQ